MIRTVLTCLFLFVALNATANDIEGKWKAVFNSPEGEMEMVINFKVSGNTFTGVINAPGSDEIIQITNGVITGNDFTFDANVKGTTIKHICKILEDGTISMKVAGQESEGLGLILTSVKE